MQAPLAAQAHMKECRERYDKDMDRTEIDMIVMERTGME